MKKTHSVEFRRGMLIIFLLISMVMMGFAQKLTIQERQNVDYSQAQTTTPERVITSTKVDLSLPLSELVKIYTPPASTNNHKVFPLKPYPFQSLIREMPFIEDPSLQDWQGARGSRTVLQNFDGLEIGDNVGGGGAPPDQNGDVGPNHYVQMANAVFEIFNKTGTTLAGPSNINVLWTGFGGPCENNNSGDPVVMYDQLADRWFLSQFAVDDPNNQSICVACSQTPDPTGAYYRYQFNFTTDFPDYPKFGVWSNAYSATYRVFPNGGNFNEKAGALERNAMLAGNPAQMVLFSISNLLSPVGADGFLPGDLDGPAPPAGTPIPVLGHQDDGLTGAPNDRLALFELTPDWNNTANSTFTGPVFLATNPYDANFAGGIPQPGTTQQLDILPHFTMYSLQTRDFGTHMSIVTNHTVDVGTNHAGIRWYELRNSGAGWSIYQQGTYAPDNDHRWMGSIAMDGAGNIALGYSVSSSTTFPAIRFTGHTAGAPLGVMDVAEESIFEGTGSQTNPDRWGDYSMMTVDPTDDATFWYTNEYYAASSSFNWKTRIASLNLGPTVTPSGILIWEGSLGGQDYSGAYINNYLTNAGLTTTYTSVFPASLIGYDAVFLSFGNYGPAGSNTVFDNTMAAQVEAYLNAGGKVYLEGGDALGFDQGANTTLLNLFGLSGTADGVQGPTPITALAGQPGALTAGMQFNASTQVNNFYIDTYTAGGGMVAFNEPTVGDVAAQYSGAGGSKTFCFSYALSELTDGTAPSTKDDLMAAIINFFGIAPPMAPDNLVWVPMDVSMASAASGDSIFNALVANGKSAMVTDNLFEFGMDLTQYDAVWVVLGIFDHNHILGAGDPEAAALETYLANGGNLYLEGGDCFAYDPVNAGGYDINPWFDCTPVGDGAGDVAGVIGLNELSAFTFAYNGENNFMDQLSAIGSSPIWQNNANAEIHGLYNSSYGAGNGKAIGVVPSFGGMASTTAAANNHLQIAKNSGTQEVQLASARTKVRPTNKSQRRVIKKFAFPSETTRQSSEKPLYKITPNGVELLANNQTDLMAAYLNIFGGGGATGTVTASVSCPMQIPQGGSFASDIRIDMSNMAQPNENLGSFTATLTWDPAMLSYTGNSGILSGFTGVVNVDAPNGTMTFNGANAFGATGVVDILGVNFDAVGAIGSNTCLTLQFSAMAAAFTFTDLLPLLQPIPQCCLDITNPCTPGLLGDVNGDAAVNSTDALIILSYDAGLTLPQNILDRINIGFGDTNADMTTNSTDALIILSYDAGLTIPFPVGDPVCLPNGPAPAPGKSETSIEKAEKNIAAFLNSNSAIVLGKTIDVPVTIDMSRTSEKLGSYTVTLQWDPAMLQFQSYSGGTTKGFSNPVVNDAMVDKGKLTAAHAYAYGADGQVNILNLRFKLMGNVDAITNEEISMEFSAMAAAKTFTDLLPHVEVGEAVASEDKPAVYGVDNYPNPFNPTTTIGFMLPEVSQTRLQIYNIRGQLVRKFVSGNLEAGYHKIVWDGRNENGVKVSSGVYIYQIHAGDFVQTKKMILMK